MVDLLKSMTASLRFRFIAAACFVLVLVLCLQVANSARLLNEAQLARENHRLAELHVLYNAALSLPLAERDQVKLTRLVGQFARQNGISYAVLKDANQRVVAAEGWDPLKPLPVPLNDFGEMRHDSERFDGMIKIQFGGKDIGSIHFGIETRALRQASAELLWQSVAIGLAALALTVILLSVIGFWLTRNLRVLQRGVAALESGASSVRLPEGGKDEIGRLTRAFNRMSQALDERVEALKKSEARFHAIADYTYGVEAWFNPQGRLIWINRSVERITGYTPIECLLSSSLIDMLVLDKDRKLALEVALKALRGSTGDNFEVRLKRKDGSTLWTVINWQPINSPTGEYLGLRVSVDDIQSRKEAELKLLDTVVELRRAQALKEYYLTHSNEERARLEALLNVMKIGVLFVDSSHRLVYINNACREIWKLSLDENLTGLREGAMLDRTGLLRQDDVAYRRHVEEVLAGENVSEAYEIQLQDGRIITDVSALVPGLKTGQYIGRVWIYEDVTRQKRLEAQLIQLAERDPLTNLYNRRRFHDELERMIADASRRKSHAGLLAIDLDGFKPINDEFGHQSGDAVLVRLAEEVGHIVRRNEIFFRVGGDEFAILAPDADEEEMIGLARRVGGKIADMRFIFNGREVTLTASLGIALYPNHAASGEEIIARADSAMYQAKMSGKNRYAVYGDAKLH